MLNDKFAMSLFLSVAFCLWARRFIYQTVASLHIFQLEGYRNLRFLKWTIKHPFSLLDLISLVAFPFLLSLSFFSESLFLILWSLLGIFLLIRCKKKEAKKPLVWTSRLKRLFSLSVGAGIFLIVFLGLNHYRLLFVGTQILLQLVSLNLILVNILIWPTERLINLRYLNKAAKKLKRLNPKVIGITGSYGKTSTKRILAHILSQKYKVLATPESYNTLMGICKVINNDLQSEHELFIVEMGAYKRGDIRELCDLVKPEIGILTGIGIQHLERFGSVENIVKAKFELIESLPADGIAILNEACEYCQAWKEKVKTIRYGEVKEVSVSQEGLSFSVHNITFQTSLLGKHNIQNILSAIACAMELEMTLEEIKEAVFTLPQIPHRLQLLKTSNSIIIDDAYNSNPPGAKEALSVLSQFSGRKILVTPGMIELGQREAEENRLFGEEAAKICDFVILVGKKRTKAILDGLLNAGFSKDNLFVVKNLDEAKDKLSQIRGDVILFENDLPETYDE